MNRGITRLATVFCVALLLVSVTAGQALAELKIGYIRPMYIFEKYEPYQDAQRQLVEIKKTQDDKLRQEEEKLQSNVEDAQKKAMLMSEEILARTREELAKQKEALDKSYNDFYQPNGEFEKKQEELIQPIIDRINDVIMRIGKEEVYDYILDAEQGGVLFADDQYDISDYILEELQKGVTKE